MTAIRLIYSVAALRRVSTSLLWIPDGRNKVTRLEHLEIPGSRESGRKVCFIFFTLKRRCIVQVPSSCEHGHARYIPIGLSRATNLGLWYSLDASQICIQ